MLTDANLDTKRKVEYYSYEVMHGTIGTTATDITVDTGASIQQEMSALGMVGVLLDTATDAIGGMTLVPRDLDWTKPIGVRLQYQTKSATAADTMNWTVLYDVIAEGTALAYATTALDTVIPLLETVKGTAEATETTLPGAIAANTITEAQVVAGSTFLVWSITLTTFAVGLAEDKLFLGLLLDYVPKRYKGDATVQNPAVTAEDAT